jgi:hypothetical protein
MRPPVSGSDSENRHRLLELTFGESRCGRGAGHAGPRTPATDAQERFSLLIHSQAHGGSGDAACWLPEISEDSEFRVFDDADAFELADDRGWLYGILRDDEGGLRDLGTWHQQIAEFPFAREGTPWHGYPLWPVNETAPDNRRGEKHRPSREVLDKMVAAGILTQRQKRRLMKGDHV